MNETLVKVNQSKASAAMEFAVSVFEDVLQDIDGWEDKALSEAVQAAKSKLLAALMTEFDLPDGQNIEPHPKCPNSFYCAGRCGGHRCTEAMESSDGGGSLKLADEPLSDAQMNPRRGGHGEQ